MENEFSAKTFFHYENLKQEFLIKNIFLLKL